MGTFDGNSMVLHLLIRLGNNNNTVRIQNYTIQEVHRPVSATNQVDTGSTTTIKYKCDCPNQRE